MTTAQKISELTVILRWFTALCLLNILTFWVAIMLADAAHQWIEKVIIAGLCVVGPLAVYTLYRLSKVEGSYGPVIWFSLFVLIPPLATIALIALCGRALSDAEKLGSRITLFPPHVTGALSCVFIVVLGCWFIYAEATKLQNHARLKKFGVPITGTLQMVTHHRVNFIPSGDTFTVSYAGRSKTFDVDSEIVSQNLLPDGRFTHHDISLVYLPDKPDVAELPGMLGFHISSVVYILLGAGFVYFGGRWLRVTIRSKPARVAPKLATPS